MYIDYETEQQILADEAEAYQGSLEHEAYCKTPEFKAWQEKQKNYFEWRERWTRTENGDLDQYAEEDNERRIKYGITTEDEANWKGLQECPF